MHRNFGENIFWRSLSTLRTFAKLRGGIMGVIGAPQLCSMGQKIRGYPTEAPCGPKLWWKGILEELEIGNH